MIVVDASVAVKWFRDEIGSDQATQFYADNQRRMIAPDLFAVEVVAALVRNANAVKASRAVMTEAIAAFEAILAAEALTLHRADGRQRAAAAALAIRIGHPFKDCLYLALAMNQDCAMMTCDTRFATRATSAWAKIDVLEVSDAR